MESTSTEIVKKRKNKKVQNVDAHDDTTQNSNEETATERTCETTNTTSVKESKKRKRSKSTIENNDTVSESVNENVLEEAITNEIAKISKRKRSKAAKLKARHSDKLEATKKSKVNSSDVEGFTILGGSSFNKKSQVKRVLPRWVANITTISNSLQDLNTKVSTIQNLDKDLKKKLKTNGIKYLFPVQATVVPWLLRSNGESNLIIPRDVCVCAPTGSGKTLTFVLPVVQALKVYRVKKIRALVILPTKDLASQVYNTFQIYATNTHIKVYLVTGNRSFQADNRLESEAKDLNGYDIIVCTPGRLVDYLKDSRGFDLKDLQFLIIDEADRIMNYMQNDWLYHLENHMNKNDNNLQSTKILNLFTMKSRPIQKLLFSATLSLDPEKLTQLSLFQPKLFACVDETMPEAENNAETYIGKYTLPNELTEKYIECPINSKPLALYKFINDEKLSRILIFTNSVEATHRLAILLQALFKNKLQIVPISSQLESNHRKNLIRDFATGRTNVIVCTDSLARGIDVPHVQCVISYGVPKHFTTYVHRVGRTARAGEPGLAVTVVSAVTKNRLLNICQGRRTPEEILISEESLQELVSSYETALEDLKKTMFEKEANNLRRMMSAKHNKKRSIKNK